MAGLRKTLTRKEWGSATTAEEEGNPPGETNIWAQSRCEVWGQGRLVAALKKNSNKKDRQIPKLDAGTHLECLRRSEGEQGVGEGEKQEMRSEK